MTTDNNSDKTPNSQTPEDASSNNTGIVPVDAPADDATETRGGEEKVETKAEAKTTSATASSPSHKKDDKPAASEVKKGLPLWALLLLLLVAGCCAMVVYFGWQWQQQQLQVTQQLQTQIAKQTQQLTSTQQQLATAVQASSDTGQQWQQSLAGLEQRIEQHSRRLRSLSTTTRDDWLLAEAEYLLRLASQRLQMERGTKGALALLQAADQILLELDDAELFAVRDKLQRDIAALKLAPSIDRSGLYLQLSSWADEIVALPDVPSIAEPVDTPSPTESPTESIVTSDVTSDVTAEVAEQSIWSALKANFSAAMQQLNDQVRIRHHDQPLEPLLPPDGAHYLRQNMRFNLEQAQLAMLREESEIYQQSLEKSEQLLRRYFSNQDRALVIADELAVLKTKNVVVELPNINGSLSALQEFIQRLHLLDQSAGSPQVSETSSISSEKAK
ncbi:MAG: uroporphyrinogen-III C-methyltransferase [Cellvibrionaceae bacterium]